MLKMQVRAEPEGYTNLDDGAGLSKAAHLIQSIQRLNKAEGYLNHTQSEEFQKEYGGWSMILRVTLGREPDERILALLSKRLAWAEDYGVNLEFEMGGKPVRIVES